MLLLYEHHLSRDGSALLAIMLTTSHHRPGSRGLCGSARRVEKNPFLTGNEENFGEIMPDFIEPTETQRRALGQYYRELIDKAAEARVQHGMHSQQYAVAVSVLTATTSAIQVAFHFKTVTDAHRWIRGLAFAA